MMQENQGGAKIISNFCNWSELGQAKNIPIFLHTHLEKKIRNEKLSILFNWMNYNQITICDVLYIYYLCIFYFKLFLNYIFYYILSLFFKLNWIFACVQSFLCYFLMSYGI